MMPAITAMKMQYNNYFRSFRSRIEEYISIESKGITCHIIADNIIPAIHPKTARSTPCSSISSKTFDLKHLWP
jgi:hypothetical protein